MKTQIASASRLMRASTETVYEILADYRGAHPKILPAGYFLSLDVDQGGFGEGTLARVSMRVLGRTRTFRMRVDEPEPGTLLTETDLASGAVTWFRVSPADGLAMTNVRITTELKGQKGLEALVAKMLLQRIYREELTLLARLAESLEPRRSPASKSALPVAAGGEARDA